MRAFAENTLQARHSYRWTLRRARRLVIEAPRPALRVPAARSAKGASTDRLHRDALSKEQPFQSTGVRYDEACGGVE
ncbi:MAG: hypothetical protein ABI627_19505 [Polyangiaceae bacterium]